MKYTLIWIMTMSATVLAGYHEMTFIDSIREIMLGLLIMGIPIWLCLIIILPIMLIVKLVKLFSVSPAERLERGDPYDPVAKREELLDSLEKYG